MLADRLRFADIRRTSAFRLTAMLGVTFAAGIVLLLGAIYLLTAREFRPAAATASSRTLPRRCWRRRPRRCPTASGKRMRATSRG